MNLGYTYEDRKNVKIEAKIPQPPKSVADLGRMAVGFFHKMLGDLYQHPVIGEVMAEEIPTMDVLYIPTTDSLGVSVKKERKLISAPKVEIRSFDPALLMKFRDHYFLVGLWDIKDELPFENLLREFTSGDAEFPTKKVK